MIHKATSLKCLSGAGARHRSCRRLHNSSKHKRSVLTPSVDSHSGISA